MVRCERTYCVMSELMLFYLCSQFCWADVYYTWMYFGMVFHTTSMGKKLAKRYSWNKSNFSIPRIHSHLQFASAKYIHKRVNACNLVWILIVTNHIIIIIFGQESHIEEKNEWGGWVGTVANKRTNERMNERKQPKVWLITIAGFCYYLAWRYFNCMAYTLYIHTF